MAKKTKILSAEEIADALERVRTRMAKDKTLNEKLTADFKEALNKEQVTSAGNYRLTQSQVFKVAIEELALPFAIERGLAKVDTARAHEVFKLDPALRFEDPARYGFEVAWLQKVVPIAGNKD